MESKTILIVDDEEAVLSVLKDSLTVLGSDYRILTAQDGKNALEFLEKYRIDLIVTDYHLQGMSGLELLEMTHNIQPNMRVIFITAYGSDEVEEKVNRLKAFAYLTKPLDLDTFRSVVKQAFGDLDTSHPGVVIYTEDIKSQISQTLLYLKKATNANFAMLVDTFDNLYVTVGDIGKVHKETLSAYVNTSLVILEKTGDLLGDDHSSSSWLSRQGTVEDLFAGKVDRKRILIVLLNHLTRSQSDMDISKVFQTAAVRLGEIFVDSTRTEKKSLFGQGFNQAMQSELDKLFTDDFEVTFSTNDPEIPMRSDAPDSERFAMSYEEALAVGLILPTRENQAVVKKSASNLKGE